MTLSDLERPLQLQNTSRGQHLEKYNTHRPRN